MYSVHHVALSVSNLTKSLSFYELFGFSAVHKWQSDDKSLTITQIKNNSGLMIELFAYAVPMPAPDTIYATATDLPVIGTKHFGLQVESIEAAKQDLIIKGIIGSDHEITLGRTGIKYFFVKDPDGILVEIVEDKRGY